MATPNMLLSLPTVSVTIGPDWANQVNAAFETVDAHDHTSDKGARITPAALDINADLDVSGQVFYNFKSIRFQDQTSTLTGSANSNALYTVNGDLYFTTGAGSAVQITSGGSIVTTPSSAQTFETIAISGDLLIGNSDTFVYIIVDTSANRQITLPLASGVSAGRIYIIKDASGLSNDNPITVTTQGSDSVDGASFQQLESTYGSWTLIGDGSANWYIS